MAKQVSKFGGKIFCIGFHKTGTTSIGAALEELGYTVKSHVGVHAEDLANSIKSIAYEQVGKFDAFQDNPWPILYKDLDRDFPDSKFILTIRTPESWIRSVVGYFGGRSTPMREWIYGVGDPLGSEEIYIARFKRHYDEVFEYFKDRPADLLVMDLPRGDGWEKLCEFLGHDVPPKPFPHRKRRAYTPFEKLVKAAKDAIESVVVRPFKSIPKKTE